MNGDRQRLLPIITRHTANPERKPPALQCPDCERWLEYVTSVIVGRPATESEQWDRLLCRWCGVFEYRHRTRRLRKIVGDLA
jgi:hypothetical protein